jgi:hypothetical protein
MKRPSNDSMCGINQSRTVDLLDWLTRRFVMKKRRRNHGCRASVVGLRKDARANFEFGGKVV